MPAFASASLPDVFLRASELTGVPLELLLAVSHVESALRPYALNIAGESFFPSSRREAEGVLLRSGPNVDIGLMQVNWGIWGRRLGYSKAELLDPALNVLLGARILRGYVASRGDWWEGVALYHSPNPVRQRRYVSKVWGSYRRVVLSLY